MFTGIDKREKELFKSGEQEPWVHRGGLLAEFRVGTSKIIEKKPTPYFFWCSLIDDVSMDFYAVYFIMVFFNHFMQIKYLLLFEYLE